MNEHQKYRQLDMTYNLAKGGIRKGLGTEVMARLFSEHSHSRKRQNATTTMIPDD
jgi:hypothetical protein